MGDLTPVGQIIPRVLEHAIHAEERHRWTGDQVWAAMQLCPEIATCQSVLNRYPVRAGNLHHDLLRRALRRRWLPDAEDHIIVTPDMLDAIAECGPLTTAP
jgi:hypothetical protein